MQQKKTHPTYKSQPFAGKVASVEEKNKIVLNAPLLYDHFVSNTCKPGDFITLYITNKRPKRSEVQNNYYWLYLSLISLSSGHTTDELHSWAKGKFLSKGIKEVYGDKVRKVKSTTELTIGEFCEYVCKIEETTEIPAPDTGPFLKALTQKEYEDLQNEQKSAYLKMEAKIVMAG